jgi:hypothetical protein
MTVNSYSNSSTQSCNREVFTDSDFIESERAASKQSETRPGNLSAASETYITASQPLPQVLAHLLQLM